jgi:hypothetical protein
MKQLLSILILLLTISSPLIATPIKHNSAILLITSDQLKESWKAFAKWKTSIGKPVKILTVSEIAKLYSGKDIQEKIRLCVLKHAETENTRWVILGGDSDQNGKGVVPDRDTPHTVMGRLTYKNIPSDIYYISDKDWDANKDGIYGEWAKDKKNISYSNKWGTTIGRIPVRTTKDVKAYTDKIIEYESSYPKKNFAKKLIYTNTTPHSQPKVINSWDKYISQNWQKAEVVRFFHTKTPWDTKKAGDYDLSPANWGKMINNKTAGKMHMHGHGFLPGWVLEKHKLVKSKEVSQLKNKEAYLIMTTVSCFTGQFDGPKDPCITESMLRAPQKGAVIIITPAREGVPIFHSPKDFKLMISEGKLDGTTETMTRFWMHGLKRQKDGSYKTAGEAFYTAKQEMGEHAMKTSGYHWCQCEINFLGDPTLDMRAMDPVKPLVKHTQQVKRGLQDIVINTGIPNSTVCLWQSGDIYEVVKADSKGQAKLSIKAVNKGTISVTVSGANINAAKSTIEVL